MKMLKKRLRDGETVHGCWLNLGSSITAEIVGGAGFDWVLIDLEHGAGGERDVLHQLQALEHTPVSAIVRVESAERQRIHRVLDLGADGIMCPRINDAADAKKVVSGMRYPPDGSRGVATMVRATGFGTNFREYHDQSKDRLLTVVQIESVDVLRHVDEIAGVDGIDVLFIGPSDLSMAMGRFGQLDHPDFQNAVKKAVRAAKENGKAAGILLPSAEDYEVYREMGMQMIACGSDASFVAGAARKLALGLDSRRSTSPRGATRAPR